jgi:hypothetical protein
MQNIISDFERDLFRRDRAGYGGSFLIAIEEVDTVGADPEVALEIPSDGRAQRIVQVPEYKAGYLFAGSIGQYRRRLFTRPHS